LQLEFKQRLGLLRSLFIYYGIPLRGRNLVRFYHQFIGPGDLCFDIGAHVGNRLRAWKKLGARVVALEPQPYLMRFLQQWYGHQKDIILLQEAVGEIAGESIMYMSSRTPAVTSLSRTWIDAVRHEGSFASVEWDVVMPVQITTMDQLIQRYGLPTFCKIDVEGYEIEVLRGLSQPIPSLSFEYIPATVNLAHDCILQLSLIGNYRFNWSISESLTMRSKAWLSMTEMLAALRTNLYKGRSGDVYARLDSTH